MRVQHLKAVQVIHPLLGATARGLERVEIDEEKLRRRTSRQHLPQVGEVEADVRFRFEYDSLRNSQLGSRFVSSFRGRDSTGSFIEMLQSVGLSLLLKWSVGFSWKVRK
jgi:hypothetical protein